MIEFRASIVIGSGSLSFEMLRALVERLPMMIAPRWVAVTTQPIGIADLLVAQFQRHQSVQQPQAGASAEAGTATAGGADPGATRNDNEVTR